MLFVSVMAAEFSASLLQSSVSHDPPKIILTFFLVLIYRYIFKTASYFCGKCDTFFGE